MKPNTNSIFDTIVKNRTEENYTQVGGSHYTRLALQPWDVVEMNNLGFFEGNIIKYVFRYKEKSGVEDLRKASHYLQRLIQIELRNETDSKLFSE